MSTFTTTTICVLALLVCGASAARSQRLKRMQKLGKLGMSFEKDHKKEVFLQKPTLPPNTVTDDQRSCKGFWLVGCMAIGHEKSHALYYKDHVAKEDMKLMTPEVCYEFCKAIDGASFFGIEMGRDCYCMPFYEKTAAGTGGCDQTCEGMPTFMCGGKTKASVWQMHDCENLPALPCNKPPPAVPYAEETCASLYVDWRAGPAPLDTINSACQVSCESGYDLISNDLHCGELGDRLSFSWSQWVGSALCAGKNCFEPPYNAHSTWPKGDVRYPYSVTYTCQMGYSLDEKPDGPKTNDLKCLETGLYDTVPPCLPVECGITPEFLHTTLTEGTLNMQHYLDELLYTTDEGYTLDASPYPTGPKTFKLLCTATGEFTKAPEVMPVSCGPAPNLGYSKWKPAQCAPALPAGALPGYKAGCPAAEDPVVYPYIVPYECDDGYTTDGMGSYGRSQQEFFRAKKLYIGCRPNGAMHDAQGKWEKVAGAAGHQVKWASEAYLPTLPTCHPVSCGRPHAAANALVDNSIYYFPDIVTYNCASGYSTDEEPDGVMTFTTQCESYGAYAHQAEQLQKKCVRIRCQVPPHVEHSTIDKDLVGPPPGTPQKDYRFQYEDVVLYTSDPGFSTDIADDPYRPLKQPFTRTCMANGEYSQPAPLFNIDECLVHDCGENGACVDHEKPTGVAYDDYHCACDSGYEETDLGDGHGHKVRMCTNINDCPIYNICEGMGACQDLLNTYTCLCFSGYQLTTQVGKASNATCEPKICGKPGDIEFSKKSSDEVKVFPDTVTYTCDKGYTIDHSPKSSDFFKVECLATGYFAEPPACLPVTCGAPFTIANARPEEVVEEQFFPNSVKYNCMEGFSIDGTLEGEIKFSVECAYNGKKLGRKECRPITCGIPPNVEFSKIIGGGGPTMPRHFQQPTKYKCNEGYSIDESATQEARWFELDCKSNGQYTKPEECKNVCCGKPPPVAYAENGDGKKYYLERTKYKLVKGYTLDQKPNGKDWFEVQCLDSGMFEETLVPLPVSCDEPPTIKHSSRPHGVLTYLQTVDFNCDTGYTIDSDPKGAPSFTIECQHDSSFKGIEECKAVICGKPPALEFGETSTKGRKTSFGETNDYNCLAGYSLDGLTRDDVDQTITCLADGEFSPLSPCINIDDCAGHQCGHGVCVDHEEPIGKQTEDYHCECDEGYEEIIRPDGVHFCGNIPDCPPNACLPGACIDLVGDYECDCPEGFEELENKAEGLAHDCFPLVCGAPPTSAHSQLEQNSLVKDLMTPKGEIKFGHSQLRYSCDKGYTLDGSPYGNSDNNNWFEVRCEATGHFQDIPGCQPVQCGQLPDVLNSVYPQNEFVYPQTATYECNTGYSTTGKVDGAKSFTIMCEAFGGFGGSGGEGGTEGGDMKTCMPVTCGEPKQIGESVHVLTEMFFPTKNKGVCQNGFSVDGARGADKKTFEIECTSDGTLITDPPNLFTDGGCKQMFCDAAAVPSVANSEITNFKPTLVFGDNLNYKCEYGYSPTATYSAMTADNSFDVPCLATGFWPESPDVPICHPNECGEAPVVDNAKAEPSSGIGAYEQPSGTVIYTCNSGYEKVSPALPRDMSRVFKAKCEATGVWSNVLTCEPVSCGKPPANPAVWSQPIAPDDVFVFPQRAEYRCLPGYSRDGKPSGQRTYKEKCQNDGRFTEDFACEDIDWCIKYSTACGDGNTCVDLLHSYKCECKEGFEEGVNEEGLPMCEDIDECTTMEGSSMCKPYGTCEDRVAGYVCKCDHGYEVEEEPDGRETCVPKVCGPPEDVEFAYPNMAGKIEFPTTVPYTCETGYSLDGKNTGPVEFYMECEDTGRFGKAKTDEDASVACEPIECEKAIQPKVKNADNQDFSKFVFPETRLIKCKKGFTVDGKASSKSKFHIDCEATGLTTDAEDCRRVTCGSSPSVSRSLFELRAYFFEDKVKYECEPGYTITGLPGGKTIFEIECNADGTYDEPHACNPVQCGVPPPIPNGIRPGEVMYYPNQNNALCMAGFAVGGTADVTSFTISCSANGDLEGIVACEPVSCGMPPAGVNAIPVQPDRKYTYQESAAYSCKPGFSTDGLPTGTKNFEKICGATGGYITSDPSDCIDIDYCNGNPCGFNGNCIDGENGYECECHGDYEIAEGPNGDTCAEDDCAGHDCGEGGACIDLSEKATGAYACECEAGYETFTRKDGEITCRRVACGNAAVIDFTESEFIPYKEGEEVPNPALPQPMFFDDEVVYTCKEGYSTDGSTAEVAKSFSVRCTEIGDTTEYSACTKIKCDSYQLPEVPNSNAFNLKDNFYEYGDVVRFQCVAGHTMSGKAGGTVDFSVECQSNGEFTLPESCSPVKCDDPAEIAHATVSPSDKIQFPMDITYRCTAGYEVAETGETVFETACMGDGLLDKQSPDMSKDDVSSLVGTLKSLEACVPVKCGEPPVIEHASWKARDTITGKAKEVPIGSEVDFETVLDFKCDEGYTLNGNEAGDTDWSVDCNELKEFVNVNKNCLIIKYNIRGIVSNAAAKILGGEPIPDANIAVGGETARTGQDGRFEVQLPAGEYTIEANAGGFISGDRPLKVSSDSMPKVSLSPTLGLESWRAVLRWEDSSDIDLRVKFGTAEACRANYKNKQTLSCPNTPVQAEHENDATKLGPETVRLDNVAGCDPTYGACLATFYATDLRKKGLDTAGVRVAVYHGTEKVEDFSFPAGGNTKIWPVFTLDAQEGAETVLYPGKAKGCPYIVSEQEADWAGSMDVNDWSKVPENGLVNGFYRADKEDLHNLDVASFYEIGNSEEMTCLNANWAIDFNSAGEVKCKDGYFIAGLWRVGGKEIKGTGIHQIDQAKCCKPKELPKTYRDCESVSLNFAEQGWAKCPEGKMMTGLERTAGQYAGLSALAKATCCKFETRSGC